MSHWTPGVSPAAGRDGGPPTTLAYSDAEWDLLTRLPGRVIVAASPAGPVSPGLTVRAGLAGLDGIAAGRIFDSDLVRAVVATIYLERIHPKHDTGVPGPVGSRDTLGDLLASCADATRVLADRADPADSAAYRQWVLSSAARVGRAAGAGVAPAAGRSRLSRAGFLDRLGRALGFSVRD